MDLLADYLDHIETKRVFPAVEPRTVNQLFAEPLPQNPSTSDQLLVELENKLLPYCTHPMKEDVKEKVFSPRGKPSW